MTTLTALQLAALTFLAASFHPIEDFEIPSEHSDAIDQLIDRGLVEHDDVSGIQTDGADVDLDFFSLTSEGRRFADRRGFLALEMEPTEQDLADVLGAW